MNQTGCGEETWNVRQSVKQRATGKTPVKNKICGREAEFPCKFGLPRAVLPAPCFAPLVWAYSSMVRAEDS